MAEGKYYRFLKHYDPHVPGFDKLQIAKEDGDGSIDLEIDSIRQRPGVQLTDSEHQDALQYVVLEEVDRDGIPVAAKGEEVPTLGEPAVPSGPPAPYDPSDHLVDEVLDHLKTADENEVQRVKRAEARGDRKSSQIRDFDSTKEGSVI